MVAEGNALFAEMNYDGSHSEIRVDLPEVRLRQVRSHADRRVPVLLRM